MSADTLTLDPRFRGPEGMGNGGYVCGLVAERIAGPAKIRLKAPTPLGVAIRIEQDAGAVRLFDGETLLVEGEPLGKPLDLHLPPPPAYSDIEEARTFFPDRDSHMAPGCFVCGIDRQPDDALCLFSGLHPRLFRALGTWTVSEDLTAEDGLVASRFLWAALDCPSYFALGIHDRVALLGGMAAMIERRPRPGEQLTVTGWPIERDGRKHQAGSVIHDSQGRAIAMARALWIDVGPVTSG